MHWTPTERERQDIWRAFADLYAAGAVLVQPGERAIERARDAGWFGPPSSWRVLLFRSTINSYGRAMCQRPDFFWTAYLDHDSDVLNPSGGQINPRVLVAMRDAPERAKADGVS